MFQKRSFLARRFWVQVFIYPLGEQGGGVTQATALDQISGVHKVGSCHSNTYNLLACNSAGNDLT
jgi:hypothetical protein